jgi:hypothetical protein
MTPKFYTYFSLLQRTLAAYNKKCDCKGVEATVTFEQSLRTRIDNDFNLWIVKFTSDAFGDQRFGGTIERATELVTIYIEQIVRQTLEACIANATGENGWFNDKPEVIEELYNFYDDLKTLNSAETET